MFKKLSQLARKFQDTYTEEQIDTLWRLVRQQERINDLLDGLKRDLDRTSEMLLKGQKAWHVPVSPQDAMNAAIEQEKLGWMVETALTEGLSIEDINWTLNTEEN